MMKMNLWLLLSFATLAECGDPMRGSRSCPDGCSCSFPPSGAEVDCSHGSIARFPVDGLPPNVTRLSIQSANLSGIAAAHLSLLPLLNRLQLYYNNLTSLPSDFLSGVPRLNSLDLTGNRLVHLPRNVFDHAWLRGLVMKDNLLQRADAEWFPNSSSITWLDLSGNRLAAAPAEVFQRLPHLEDLDLSGNGLLELRAHALDPLGRLKMLNLANNKLISLKPATFSHNLQLSRLFLQENRLRELPGTLLRGLEHLELLLLNQNQLRALPAGLLDGRRASFRVILSGNPWQCDGEMEYLWKWLGEHPQSAIFVEEVTCDGPETLQKKQVTSLTGGQLGLIKIK